MAGGETPSSSSVIVQLVSEDGVPAGGQIDLPQATTAQEMQALLNQLLGNVRGTHTEREREPGSAKG